MHYQALLTVELPTVKRDPEYDLDENTVLVNIDYHW